MLFYQSKERAMIEKCQMTAAEISKLDVLNQSTVSEALAQMESLKVTRLVVTDQSCATIYDTYNSFSNYTLFPEVVKAIKGFDVFSWQYQDGSMYARAATPIYSYGALVGCIYMMESDSAQGALIQSLQDNILTITLILQVGLIFFSFIFSNAFSLRLRRILSSIRVIREGDYTHRVSMGGHDELTVLGAEFNDLTDRLQESEQERRQFVSDASHELKTPLASIKLLTDSILQNEMDIDTIREFVGDIGNEAERLNRMSQKLLALSRVEAQVGSDAEIIYMKPTIKRVERMLHAIATQNHIQIALDLEDDSPVLMMEDDLYQITFNLAENGIKYNSPGGSLLISVHREEDMAILKVQDTGVGIPESACAHIFERFYRVDKARSRKSGGSGLGLAIVRSLVERNNGTITLSSVVGEGSVFTVTFPVFDTEVDHD